VFDHNLAKNDRGDLCPDQKSLSAIDPSGLNALRHSDLPEIDKAVMEPSVQAVFSYHTRAGLPLDGLAEVLVKLAEQRSDWTRLQKIISELITHYESNGWPLQDALRSVSDFYFEYDDFEYYLAHFVAAGGTLDTVTLELQSIRPGPEPRKIDVRLPPSRIPEYLELSNAMQAAHWEGESKRAAYKKLNEWFAQMVFDEVDPRMIAKLAEAVRSGLTDWEQLKLLVADLVTHSVLMEFQANPGGLEISRLSAICTNWVNNDHLPYDQDDSQNAQAFGEVLNVFRGAIDGYYGFSALTFDCKRMAPERPALIFRMASELARSTSVICSEAREAWPGPGLVLHHLRPERFLKADQSNPKDPFHHYKKKWPWISRAIDLMPMVEIALMRGKVAIHLTQEGCLHEIPYDYSFENEHFRNIRPEFHLCPSEVLWSRLRRSMIPFGDRKRASHSVRRAELCGIDGPSLRSACDAAGLNFLNLACGSIIGGLSNAYPPDSAPYYEEWNKRLRESGRPADIYGFVHKSYRHGFYEGNDVDKLDRILEPLRQAHREVYDLATLYQDIWDLFRFALAAYHKGETRSGGELFIEEQDKHSWDAIHPNRFRMLNEAYRWHTYLHQIKAKRDDFPILTLADTWNYRTQPAGDVLLDTYSMSAHVKRAGGEYRVHKLAAGRDHAEENGEVFWLQHVVPRLAFTTDIRFYHRDELTNFTTLW